MFTQVGVTGEGKPVYAGLYRFFETHGIPLDVLLQLFRDRGLVPSWLHFYDEARVAGMEHARILSRLDAAISDSFGSRVRDVVIRRLDALRGRA